MKTVCVLIAIVLLAAYFGPAEPSKTESAMPADQTLMMMAAPAIAVQQ
jgi:ABC-type transport system involved in cytochrome c biogenesis permease subunit